MKKPSNPDPYPELAPGGWTVEKIRSALLNLEQGYLSDAPRLTRALSRHPRYVQGREQFKGAVKGCPAEVLAAPLSYGGVGTARRLAEEAGPMLARVLANGTEDWLIEWSTVMPLTVGVLRWDTTARPWVPVALERWPGEAIRVDLHARKLWARLANGREEEIVGGNGTWVVAWAGGEFDFAAGIIRCLGETWLRGINANREVGNRATADSVSAVIQTVPAGENNMQATEVVEYEEHLKNLQKGGRAGIMAPPGWEPPTALDLATKNASSSLELNVKTANTDLLVPWLMQDGTATNEGGSLAKAQVLDGVLFSAVAAKVARLWGEEGKDGTRFPGVITSQIVRPWVLYQTSDPKEPEPRGDVVPLAIRRVPDLEEDARLTEEGKRAATFWAEVRTTEEMIRRDMTTEELVDLAEMRGARIPATVLKERGERPPPVPPSAIGAVQ